MDTSENKKRVLDLLWKNYDAQIISSRRFGDRVTIVIGATVGAFGLIVRLNDGDAFSGVLPIVFIAVALLTMVLAFWCAAMVWRPKMGEQPSGTNVDRLWEYLVAVDDDESAATLMADICKATKAERLATEHLAMWFSRCMICCGISLMSVIASEMVV